MLRLMLCIIIFIAPTIAFGKNNNNYIESRFNFSSDMGVYVFEIERFSEKEKIVRYESSKENHEIPIVSTIKSSQRNVKITCAYKCVCKEPYKESLETGSSWPNGSGLFQIFQPQDESRQLVTIWAASTSYNIAIYGCLAGAMQRILVLNSRTVPIVQSDKSGYPKIKFSPDHDKPNLTRSLHWSGEKYQFVD